MPWMVNTIVLMFLHWGFKKSGSSKKKLNRVIHPAVGKIPMRGWKIIVKSPYVIKEAAPAHE